MRVAFCVVVIAGIVATAAGGRAAVAGGCQDVHAGGFDPSWVKGTQLAYAAADDQGIVSGVAKVDVATTDPACIVATVPDYDGTGIAQVAIARGHAIFSTYNFSLYIADVRTGRIHWRTHRLGAFAYLFALSPRGRQLAITADCGCSLPDAGQGGAARNSTPGTRVGVLPSSGGRIDWLSGKWPGVAQDPTFSPNGRKVAFATPSGIAVEPVRGRSESFFTLPERCFSTAWSPDGHWIACLAGQDKLTLVNTSTGAARPLPGSFEDFSWAPNSKRLAVQGPHVLIGTVDLRGNLRVLVKPGLLPGGTAAWSPDCHLIAFDAATRGNRSQGRIYVIRPNGNGLRRVA